GGRLPGTDENNIFIESYPQGWLWNIPLHTGWASIRAVVDSRAGQEGIQACGPKDFLARQIGQTTYTAQMLKSAQLVSGPFIVKDWSYMCEQMVGDGYIMVGDAACFIDPLFSSGVHLALMSGVMAAAYVTSALQDSGLGEAARLVYQELYRKEYLTLESWPVSSIPATGPPSPTSGKLGAFWNRTKALLPGTPSSRR
ncbi:MAG TPA: tryptophan 7-halogenase, partial [Dehalococcoidia bacterium]|nr:tryptophan 7-halogenase [Dehalococcoidia bacterium]